MAFKALETQPVSIQPGVVEKPESPVGFKRLAKQPGQEQATKKIYLSDRNLIQEVPVNATKDEVEEALFENYKDDPAEGPGFFPHKEKDWKSRGKIGFFELARRRDLADLTEVIPVTGSIESASKSIDMLMTVNRLKANDYQPQTQANSTRRFGSTIMPKVLRTPEEQRQDDTNELLDFLMIAEEERVRGYTWGGKVASGVLNTVPFIGEFILTGGWAALGKQAIKHSAFKVGKKVLQSEADNFLAAGAKSIVKSRASRGAVSVAAAGAGAVTRSPAFIFHAANKNAQDRVNGSLAVTEKGDVILQEMDEKPYTTAVKAYADTLIELFSEVTGPGFKVVGKTILKPVLAKFPTKLANALGPIMMRMNPGKKAEKIFNRAGISGFLEEYGEERLGGLLRATLGVEDFGTAEGASLFDKILASIPQGEDALVELGVLAFPQGARLGVQEAFRFAEKRLQAKKEVKAEEEEVEAIEEMGPELEGEVPLTEPVEGAEEVTLALEQPTVDKAQAFAEEIQKQRETEPEQLPETEEEAEVREAEETILFEQTRKERNKQIGKFRRPKGKVFKEELAGISRTFITTDADAEGIDEAADRMGMTTNELISELQETSRRDKGSAERVRQAKKTIRTSKRKETLRQKRQVIRDKIDKKRASVEEIKQDLIDFITTNLRLDFRGRRELFAKVKNVKTEKQLLTAMARVDQLAEQQGRRLGLQRLKKVLEGTKPTKVSGKLTGKFTPEVQEYLDIARESVKLSAAEAQARLEANMQKSKEGFPPVEIAVENEILELVAGLENKTSLEIQRAINTIVSVKELGRQSNALTQLARKTKQEALRVMAENIITGGQAAVKIESSRSENADDKAAGWWNRLLPSQLSWRNLMNRLSIKDKTSAREESELSKATKVSHIETAEKKGRRQWLNKFIKAYQDVFGKMSESQMQKKFAEDSIVNSLGVFKDANGQSVDLRLSKAEARKRFMEFQDPTLDETFTSEDQMAYTEDMMRTIEDSLSDKDKAFVENQLKLYQEYYKRFNKVFSAQNGINLPNNPFYSPIARETGRKAELAVNEFLDEVPMRRSVTPGAAKVRVKNKFKLREMGDIWVFQKHIRDVEHYVAWADKIRELNAIFSDPNIRKTIVTHHGKGILSVIDGFIEDFTRGQIDRSRDTSWLNTLKNNYVVSTLMLKTAIGVKQLMSFPAFADGIPAHEFMIGLLDFARHPIEHTKILATSELMQARGLNITQEMAEAAATTEYRRLSALFEKVKSFRRLSMCMVKLGDRGAIFFGGWSVYRYNRVVLKKGHKAAIQAFEEATASAQQSTDLSELSAFQRGNSWQRLFAVFHSSQNQYFRKELTSTQDFIAGRLSAKKYAKFILIYHFILPMFFQFAADGFKFNPDEQKRAAILGAFNGWFIMGEIMNSAIRALLGLKVWDQKTAASSVFDGFIRALQKLNSDDFTPEDYFEVIEKAMVSVGELSGLGVKQGLNVKQGFAEISDGNFEKGFKLIAGWSEYVIDGNNPEGSGRKFKH